MERLFADYFHDMLDAIQKVGQFTHNMDYADFAQDAKTVFAVIRGLEIVGEAAGKIPPEIQQRYPDLPWREMTGMRNKLIHDYFGVDSLVVWKAATEDLPAVEPKIRAVLASLDKS